MRIPVGGGNKHLSDEAKHLAYRFLIGDINDLQLNFLAHQKHLDKQEILLFIKSVRRTGKFITVVGFFVLLGLLLFLINFLSFIIFD